MKQAHSWLLGGGEMAALVQTYDWSRTPLGPLDAWPQCLRTVVGMMLASRLPMILLWGPELIQIYNDGYRDIMGVKHPGGLGQRNAECWPEVWDFTGPVYEGVARGESFTFEDQRLILERQGYAEETYFTLSYSPVPDETGGVAGIFVTVVETTEKVLTQAALEVSERARRRGDARSKQLESFDAVLGQLQEFVYLFDREGRFRYVNQPLLDLWGLTLDQALGKDVFDLGYPEELATSHAAEIRQVIETARPVDGEVTYTTPPRLAGVYEYVFVPLLAPDGSVEAVGGRTQVLTDRRQAEAELRESQTRLSGALALAQFGTFEWKLRTNEVTLDERSREIFGFGPGEGTRAQEIFDRIHPEEFERVFAQAQQAQSELLRLETDYRILLPDGTYRSVVSISDTEAGPNGTADRIFGVFGDVTKWRKSEAAEREMAARYERQVRLFDGIASTTPDFVYLFDREGRFQYANRRLLDVWGMDLPDVIGKTCLELGYERWHHDMHMREIAQVIETKQPIKGEVPFEAPLTGIFGVYEYIFTPVVSPDGEVEFIAGTTRDITERRQAAEALQEAARRKDEFLATLAHELRNPLAPLLTAVELQRLQADNRAAVERSRMMIQRQVEHMQRLIDDLLDVARITRGMVDLRVETVELGSFLASAVEMARPLIDQRRQELTVSTPVETVWLEGDPHRLTQVVTNLLSNAAKFTPEGGRIMVAAERRSGEVVIRVRDTGKGIPSEMLPHIFDLFTQVHPSIDRAEGGLGLGLTLVQKLVEMHGGHVEAHSAGRGQGSEIVIRLPARGAAPGRDERTLPAAPGAEERKLRVLVVDDNRDAADTLAELLPLWGHEAHAAYAGPQALALAQERRPDVVLLDIGLPGMDGYAVAEQLRADAELASVCLIAVTGFGQEEDRQRGREAGFDAHLTKPVDPEELRRALEVFPARG